MSKRFIRLVKKSMVKEVMKDGRRIKRAECGKLSPISTKDARGYSEAKTETGPRYSEVREERSRHK